MPLPRRRRSDGTIINEDKPRFGTIAVKKGFIAPEQFKTAMTEQIDDDLAGRPHRLLGSILYASGWLSKEQIQGILADLEKLQA